MADCNNNCEAVAGLNEAAANLIQYSNLINSWLNGGSNQTVNVGGTNIPTLLGLACEIRQLVGVWPDGLTIKMDPANKKIYVPLKPNSGVHVGSQGLYIDSSDFLQIGGGLAKDTTTGQLYVDFDQMPTSKFDAILETFRKGLRLPKWLTANKNFYVDKNHAAASDTLDEGRGESPSLPFKTIQACVNYVCNNYNVGPYNIYINIADGNYEESITMPEFSRTTGSIVLRSQSSNRANTKIIGKTASVVNCTGGQWSLEPLTIESQINLSELSVVSHFYMSLIQASNNSIFNMNGCLVRFNPTGNPPNTGMTVQMIYAYGGRLQLQAGEIANRLETTHDYNNEKFRIAGFCSAVNGSLTAAGSDSDSAKVAIEANAYFNICAWAQGGNIDFSTSRKNKPSVTNSATAFGRRYTAQNGGHINTGGQGPDFFPGSTAGTVESSTYSWYK